MVNYGDGMDCILKMVETITFKRIISTTKLIDLEKELNKETIKINKLYKIKRLLDKKIRYRIRNKEK